MVSAAARYGPRTRADLAAVPVPEPAGNLVRNAERGDEDEALRARGCHRLNDPCRLHVEVASQIGQFQMLGTIFRGQPTGMFGGTSRGGNGCERCR